MMTSRLRSKRLRGVGEARSRWHQAKERKTFTADKRADNERD
jgi:hypothetical protein